MPVTGLTLDGSIGTIFIAIILALLYVAFPGLSLLLADFLLVQHVWHLEPSGVRVLDQL